MTDGNIHKGHRQKLKNRVLAGGLAGEAPHTILELLLFYGIPRKDTNPIAHELLDRFGSLSGVLRAGVEELKSVQGMTENAALLLHLILPVYAAYEEDLRRMPTLPESAAQIVDFMRPKLIGSTTEKAYLLCIGGNGKLLGLRKICEGDLSSAAIDLRALAAAVLETKAQDAILVHNHPNGVAAPSLQDIDATKQIVSFLDQMKVRLVNHIILSENDYCSMADKKNFVHLFYGMEPLY
ncbi:MAG: RadC family protein [Clostridia bacterium]|nr:RadC family protein [Clostridia bacterium]MBQ6093323.1 RadC family protein [Clostridia bacterium]